MRPFLRTSGTVFSPTFVPKVLPHHIGVAEKLSLVVISCPHQRLVFLSTVHNDDRLMGFCCSQLLVKPQQAGSSYPPVALGDAECQPQKPIKQICLAHRNG
ncbi:unnamed protein product [Peronospora belbahrii]|uniref:Uncharacterized protein n=1 Tax=Peronospora belbahrii TaxID=622444 RepID=A0AAU9KTZ7_9STRA|nr:unnamed protein product [Peronospora belbahrii]